MYQFIESIKCLDGKLLNTDYHIRRMNNTIKHFYEFEGINLDNIKICDEFSSGLYKLRVIYSSKIENYEFIPYYFNLIKSLKVIISNSVDYSFKYLNRSNLDNLFNQRAGCDDILIVKNGFFTDSYYCNLVFDDGVNLISPKSPLLLGTKRQFLLDNQIISTDNIHVDKIGKFKKVHLINSMIDIGDCAVDVDNISMDK